MDTDYILVKIDEDRMTHGKDVEARYRKGAEGGIPWFFMLNAANETVATSDGPKGNVGHPYEPHEVDHFLEMVKKTATRMTAEQRAELEKALRAQKKAK